MKRRPVRGENMPQGPAARGRHDLEAEQRGHRGQSLGRLTHTYMGDSLIRGFYLYKCWFFTLHLAC